MRIFSIILIIIVSFNICSFDANASIWNKLFKTSTKTVAKKTGKETSNEVAKRVIIKEFGQSLSKKEAKKISAKSAREITEKNIKNLDNSFSDIMKIQLSRNIDDISLKSGKILAPYTSKQIAKKVSFKQVKETTNKTTQQHIKKTLQKRVVKEVAEKTLMKQLVELLGERGAKEWCEKIAKENLEQKSKILLADLTSNKQLRKLFKKNPALLEAYHRLIGSKQFRGDISILRYLNNGASKFYNKGISAINKFGDGSNLIFRETKKGITEIVDKNTGEFFGTIIKDKSGKYIIDVPTNGNRTLLNLFPLPNTVYKSGTHQWITNSTGQVVKVKYTITPNTTKGIRNKNMDTSMGTYKNVYNTEGRVVGDTRNMPDDQGGHLIALEHGGTSDMINYIPQSKKLNISGGAWREAEKAARKAADTGKRVECTINLSYPNKTSLRPNSMSRQHIINGEFQEIKHKKGNVVLDGNDMWENEYTPSNTPRSAVKIPMQ